MIYRDRKEENMTSTRPDCTRFKWTKYLFALNHMHSTKTNNKMPFQVSLKNKFALTSRVKMGISTMRVKNAVFNVEFASIS